MPEKFYFKCNNSPCPPVHWCPDSAVYKTKNGLSYYPDLEEEIISKIPRAVEEKETYVWELK